jgi:peptidoglycan/xylan/chitin deacetylase (PgdA/CDA1 family)
MYHRVADAALDPWGIAVAPAHFEEHLDVLRRTRRPLRLTDFVRAFQAGILPRNAVAVTFDDGYVDNLVAAKPRLMAADVPATVFLATGYLGRAGEFWWDELARLILTGRGPRNFEITIGGQVMRFDLHTSNDAIVRGNGWRAWLDSPSIGRQAAYLAIWKALRAIDSLKHEAVMANLRKVFASDAWDAESGRSMTPEEVRALVSDRLVAIGPHTVTHPALTELDHLAIRREVAASKKACELLAGEEVTAFAYPFGVLNGGVTKAVADAGFICACSTKNSPVTPGSEIFALPRIQVVDEGGDAFERSLRYTAFTNA